MKKIVLVLLLIWHAPLFPVGNNHLFDWIAYGNGPLTALTKNLKLERICEKQPKFNSETCHYEPSFDDIDPWNWYQCAGTLPYDPSTVVIGKVEIPSLDPVPGQDQTDMDQYQEGWDYYVQGYPTVLLRKQTKEIDLMSLLPMPVRNVGADNISTNITLPSCSQPGDDVMSPTGMLKNIIMQNGSAQLNPLSNDSALPFVAIKPDLDNNALVFYTIPSSSVANIPDLKDAQSITSLKLSSLWENIKSAFGLRAVQSYIWTDAQKKERTSLYPIFPKPPLVIVDIKIELPALVTITNVSVLKFPALGETSLGYKIMNYDTNWLTSNRVISTYNPLGS